MQQKYCTAAYALATLVSDLRSAGSSRRDVRALLFESLSRGRRDATPGLLGASDEMPRRGLAIICKGEQVIYACRRTELERLLAEAQAGCRGRWGLASFCCVDLQVFRGEKRRGRRLPPLSLQGSHRRRNRSNSRNPLQEDNRRSSSRKTLIVEGSSRRNRSLGAYYN